MISSTTPNNVQTTDSPVFQDWAIDISPVFEWRQGDVIPGSNTVNLKIRDIIGTDLAEGYSNFKFWFTGVGKPDWIHVDCPMYSTTTPTPINSEGMETNIIISVINYLSLSSGYYQHNLLVYVSGQSSIDIAHNTNTMLSLFFIPVNFRIYSPLQCTYHPFSLDFVHRKNTPLPPPQAIIFSAPNWEVYAPNGFILSSDDPSVNIEVLFGSFYKASGSGTKTVNFGLSDFHDSLDIASEPYIEYVQPKPAPPSNPFLSFPINIWILEDLPFEVIPNPLTFNAVKNIDEADPIAILVNSHYSFTIENSPWLNLSATSGYTGSQTITVTPLATAYLDPGVYYGFIKFKYSNESGLQEFIVPVTYTVEGFIIMPYLLNAYNFTLDDKYILFNTNYEATFFDMQLKIKVFEFYSGETKNYILPFKIPTLNKKGKFNIGLIIHRVMHRFFELNILSGPQYKAAEVTIDFTERYIESLAAIRSFTSDQFLFVAGMLPSLSFNNRAILNINSEETRIFKSTIQRVNLLIPSGQSQQIQILKNGTITNSYIISSGYSLYTDIVDFSVFNAQEGDRFEYRLIISDSEYISKSFIVFPDGNYHYTLFWEDEYLLVQNFDFTGKHQIKNDFEYKNQLMYDGIVEKLRSYDNVKTPKLLINTGFISKKDIPTIESIVRSRRVWIERGNSIIEMVPLTKSITTADNDKALINFDLEFQINRPTNEEVCK